MKAFGDSAKAVGMSLATAGVSIGLPLALSAKRFADFDDQMRAVQGVTRAGAADFEMLTEKAKALGASTSFTAVQVGALMLELGRAGFNPQQIDTMTASVLDLARATGTEAALASGIMAASIRQFGLEAKDATRVADVLTAGANMTFNTVESIGEALKYAGPVAAKFNMSIEDTVAVIGALGNVGIQGSMAGTALRRLLIITGAEAEEVKRIFGVTAKDTAGNARPLVDILGEITESTKGLGTAARAEKFEELFGLLGITGATAIGASAASAKELQQALYAAGGTAADTAKKMDAGLGGAIRITLSAIEGAAIAIGGALSPVLMDLGLIIQVVMQNIIAWTKENKELVAGAGVGVMTLIAVGGAFIALGIAIKLAAFALGLALVPFTLIAGVAGLLVGVFAGLFSITGILVAGVAGLAAVFLFASEEGAKARSAISDAFAGIKDAGVTAWGGIKDAIASGDLAGAAAIGLAALKVIWLEVLTALKATWEAFVEFMTALPGRMWSGIKSAWSSVMDFMGNAFYMLIGGLEKAWVSFAAMIERTGVKAAVGLPKEMRTAMLALIDAKERHQLEQIDKKTDKRTGEDKKKEAREALAQGREWLAQDRKILAQVEERIAANKKFLADDQKILANNPQDEEARARIAKAQEQLKEDMQLKEEAEARIEKNIEARKAEAEAAGAKDDPLADRLKQAKADLEKLVGEAKAKREDLEAGKAMGDKIGFLDDLFGGQAAIAGGDKGKGAPPGTSLATRGEGTFSAAGALASFGGGHSIPQKQLEAMNRLLNEQQKANAIGERQLAALREGGVLI